MKTTTMLVIFALLSWGCAQEAKFVEVDPMQMAFTRSSQSTELKVVVKDASSVVMENEKITFTSENNNVVTVDSSGKVKPVGNGKAAIVIKTANGAKAESFVKVCLPKGIICSLEGDKLMLKVGTDGPIQCEIHDCNDEKIATNVKFVLAEMDKPHEERMVLQSEQSPNIFTGLKVGDTEVVAKALGLEKKISIHVDEQTFRPGFGPDAPKRGGGGGGGGGKADPYGKSKYDHIMKNMKFSD